MTDKQRLQKYIQRQAKIELCKRSFWEFCQTIQPDFYKKNRTYLKNYCNLLQDFYEDKLLNDNGKPYQKLMVNIGPRFGKSLTLQLFACWIIGNDTSNKIFTVSYNEQIASTFSRHVRNTIDTRSGDGKNLVYGELFPKAKIKRGEASAQEWSVEGSYFTYLGTSFSGRATGKGCNLMIFDDPIKSAEEAYNQTHLNKIYQAYANTFQSRLEKGGKTIILHTRWSSKDLCGRLLEIEPEDWYVHKVKTYNEETDTFLCEEILDRERWESLKKTFNEDILQANYNQVCIDIKGRLYNNLQTYKDLPEGVVKCIVDVADKGSDYLCSIVYKEVIEKDELTGKKVKKSYIIDVLYTKEPLEKTEKKVAEQVNKFDVREFNSERNGIGATFKRAIQRLSGNNRCKFTDFHTKSNKTARILSNATNVMNNVYFPENWNDKFPEFYRDLSNYQKEGKNKNDDAPDAVTLIAENLFHKEFIIL